MNRQTQGQVIARTNVAEGKEEDLSAFVETMLKDMQTKFDDMSKNVVGKYLQVCQIDRIDDMSVKINELEASLNKLIQEAEADSAALDSKSPTHPS